MCEVEMTEYTFEVKKRVTVKVYGNNTDDNYKKASKEAVRQIKKSIDEGWIKYTFAVEYKDYEKDYEGVI